MPLSIQYYCPIVKSVQNSHFYLYALSLLAGFGSGTIIPDPGPGKSSGYMRIRIHNTGLKCTSISFNLCKNDNCRNSATAEEPLSRSAAARSRSRLQQKSPAPAPQRWVGSEHG